MEYMTGGGLRIDMYMEKKYSEPQAVFSAACVVLRLECQHCHNIAHRYGVQRWDLPVFASRAAVRGAILVVSRLVWAGIIIFEMLVGETPFSGDSFLEVVDRIVNDEVQYPKFLSAEAYSVLIGLLEKDPRWRLGVEERGGEEVKLHPFFESVE
ncbi:serine/threonine-protein kinase N2 [Amia ocellicauda]|uniref:serine/threonine-protein kinase N2 n=1 Tax=Amia ocellicauda TaxID=2972642 RepID=UPI003464E1B7